MSPARRLLLNCRLVKAPVDAIDYVITHELCVWRSLITVLPYSSSSRR
jgi:hypothetical protein